MNWFSRFRIATGEFIAGSTQRDRIQKEQESASAKDDIISAKNDQIVTLEKELAGAKAKDDQIARLEREIGRLKESAVTDVSTTEANDNQIAALEKEIANLKEKLEVSGIESQSTRGTTFKSKKAKSKDAKGDPYQQLGEDLINALKRTTKGGHDQS